MLCAVADFGNDGRRSETLVIPTEAVLRTASLLGATTRRPQTLRIQNDSKEKGNQLDDRFPSNNPSRHSATASLRLARLENQSQRCRAWYLAQAAEAGSGEPLFELGTVFESLADTSSDSVISIPAFCGTAADGSS